MQTMTYGTLPTRDAFDTAFELCIKPAGYSITLGRTDSLSLEGFKLGDGTYTASQLWDAISEIVNAGGDAITVTVDYSRSESDDLENVYSVEYPAKTWPFYCMHYTARDAGHDSAPFLEIGPDDDELIRHAEMFGEHTTTGTDAHGRRTAGDKLDRAVSTLNYAAAYGTVGHDFARRDAALGMVSAILSTLGFEWI